MFIPDDTDINLKFFSALNEDFSTWNANHFEKSLLTEYIHFCTFRNEGYF